MARKLRIHYPGALYHVMVRGNNGENVLLNEVDKKRYLDILVKYKEEIGFKLYAFCIMDNHAHLLIEVQNAPLSQIMQRVQQVYTQWFNRKHDRTGHVFQQRYKAKLCSKENYLLQLIRYIHNNPVKANLADGIAYKWSSHMFYTGARKCTFVDVTDILNMFSENKKVAIKEYLQFMNQATEDDVIYEDPDEFQSKIEPEQTREDKYLNIDNIIEEVCLNENISIDEVTRKTKVQRVSDIRKAIVLLSEKYCNITNSALSQKLNLSPAMISKIKSGVSKGTIYVEDIIERWEMNK